MAYVSNGIPPRGEDFVNAVRTLAQLAGVTFPERSLSPEEVQRVEQRDRRGNLMEDFHTLAQSALKGDAGKDAQAYLEKRGFTPDQIENLGFGFYTTPAEVKATLLKKGYSEEEIGYPSNQVNSEGKSKGSGLIYDGRWQGRLVGPWRDRGGRIVNLWARDLSGKAENHEKYLMITGGSKASPFGMEAVRGKDLILVEGFLDALSLRVRGIPDVVAVGGTDLSAEQVETLVSARIVSLTLNLDYDGPDGAGEKGTAQALSRLDKAPFSVFVVDPVRMADNGNVLEKVDPDTYVRNQGVDAYNALLDQKEHAYRYKAQTIIRNHRAGEEWTDTGLTGALDEAVEFDASVTDPQKMPGLDLFFWPEILQETGADEEAIEICRQAIRAKQDREREQREYQSLIREAAATLQEGRTDEAKSILREGVDRLRVEERYFQADPVISVSGELQAHAERLERWRGQDFIGLPQKTLPALDTATLGLRGLMLLAAPPNVGKTALAVQFGLDVVENNPEACFLFLSLEMSRWDILSRMKCRLAGVDWKTLVFGSKTGRGRGQDAFYTSEEMNSLQQAEEKLKEIGKRVRILDERNFPVPTVEKVLAQLEDLKARTGTTRAFLLVDYLQVWPVPPSEAQRIRSDLDADKWRIGAMKTLRDASDGDAVMVISEARKPSGADRGTWGGDLSDVMGSARGTYTPDMVFLFQPFDDKALKNALKKALKLPDDDEKEFESQRKLLGERGISYNKLTIAKGRDGVLRDTLDLTFWFRQSRFEEGVVDL